MADSSFLLSTELSEANENLKKKENEVRELMNKLDQELLIRSEQYLEKGQFEKMRQELLMARGTGSELEDARTRLMQELEVIFFWDF